MPVKSEFLSSVIRLLILLPVQANRSSKLTLLRVIAGMDDLGDKYPFVVTLLHVPYLYRFCTGSLVSPNWVLTAAHCFQNLRNKYSENEINIRYGNLTVKLKYATLRDVLGIFIAPNFKKIVQFNLSKVIEMPLVNDVALLKIKTLLVPTGKICAVDFKSLIGRPVRYIGTGSTVRDSIAKYNPQKLLLEDSKDQRRMRQIGEAVIVKCPLEDPDEVKTNAALLCLRPKCSNRYQRVQTGDSGGPLLFKGKIVGVACTVKQIDLHHEAMFTAISPYLDWIQSHLSTNTT